MSITKNRTRIARWATGILLAALLVPAQGAVAMSTSEQSVGPVSSRSVNSASGSKTCTAGNNPTVIVVTQGYTVAKYYSGSTLKHTTAAEITHVYTYRGVSSVNWKVTATDIREVWDTCS